MRWVDPNKSFTKNKYDIRSRMVAKNYKGGDKGRDDLFAEPPPFEAKRMLFSRAVTMRKDKSEECHCPPGFCGKL
eukprot:3057697-Karenia_brevis.AAC.1